METAHELYGHSRVKFRVITLTIYNPSENCASLAECDVEVYKTRLLFLITSLLYSTIFSRTPARSSTTCANKEHYRT